MCDGGVGVRGLTLLIIPGIIQDEIGFGHGGRVWGEIVA
jgi:hypothetical protein